MQVLATYSPVLSADVINVQSLAAWHLHMLLAPQLRAWLSSGEHVSSPARPHTLMQEDITRRSVCHQGFLHTLNYYQPASSLP